MNTNAPIYGLRILRAGSLQEAAQLAARFGGEARWVAGATALQLEWRRGVRPPAYLIDLNGLGELRGMSENADGVHRIGALTRLCELEKAEFVAAARHNDPADRGTRSPSTGNYRRQHRRRRRLPCPNAPGARGVGRGFRRRRIASTFAAKLAHRSRAATRDLGHCPSTPTSAAPSCRSSQDRITRHFQPKRYWRCRRPRARSVRSD